MWHKEGSLWVPGRKRFYHGALPGAVASQGVAAPPAIPFEIINAGTAGVDSNGSETSQVWTTAAGTTLLVVCAHLGGGAVNDDFSALSFDNDAMTEIGLTANAQNARPGQQWWYLQNPSIGSNLTLAYTLAGTWGTGSYHAIQCFNIRGEHTTPIGAVDLPGTTSDAVASLTDSITSMHAGSILLSGGCWQGEDQDPLTALEDLTRLAFGVTGGGSNSQDGAFAIGWKQLTTATSYNYGWAAGGGGDGAGISAVEIRAAA